MEGVTIKTELETEDVIYESTEIGVKEEKSEESFCFNSDHVTLKMNQDYQNLLKAIFLLEHKRAQAIKDLNQLYECQEEALANPISFVERLQRGEDLKIPGHIKVPELPVIDWHKYALSENVSCDGVKQPRACSKVQNVMENGRGKLAKKCESRSKNQYWTAEEQKKLEELLIQFPCEEVESHRWQKIANCLGNRTPIQVATRVQKYFIRLMKAGLPIPGRRPNITYMKKKNRRKVIRQKPSTFMVSVEPPVYMPEFEDDYNSDFFKPRSIDENSGEHKMNVSEHAEEYSPALQDTPEYQELMLLEKIKEEKQKSIGIIHVGYKCCHCSVQPIVGVRWHCMECKSRSFDLCADCRNCKNKIGEHTFDHQLEAVEYSTTAFVNQD